MGEHAGPFQKGMSQMNAETRTRGISPWWWALVGAVGLGAIVGGLVLRSADKGIPGGLACDNLAVGRQKVETVFPLLHPAAPPFCNDISGLETLGLFLLVFGIVVLAVGAMVLLWLWRSSVDGSSRSRRSRTPMKTCPACAEKVKAEAEVCRFCGREFDAQPNPASTEPLASLSS
jgi:hypothetical protein